MIYVTYVHCYHYVKAAQVDEDDEDEYTLCDLYILLHDICTKYE